MRPCYVNCEEDIGQKATSTGSAFGYRVSLAFGELYTRYYAKRFCFPGLVYADFMERGTRSRGPFLTFLLILASCVLLGATSKSQQLHPVASLELSDVQAACCKQPAWATVAFPSNGTIAVSRCHASCSLSLIQWDGQALRLSAQTATDTGAVSIFPAQQGIIFSMGVSKPVRLYSADLTTSHELPSSISMFSETGRIAAATTGNQWTVYRLDGALQPLLKGAGNLQSISDGALVIRDANVVKVNTTDGVQMGSFSVPTESGCASVVRIISRDRLYLNDCRSERIVDFRGKTILQLRPPEGCCFLDDGWSADGKRLLFDYRNRKVFLARNAREILRMFATLGMSGEEWPNQEAVQVVDTLTGAPCLKWHRTFATAKDVALGQTAAISPSGEFVAIATNNKLSVYQLSLLRQGKTSAMP
ncbi:MAG: hypothetical protein WB460_03940 [Candidatus Acidiferrales bacterium]